MTASAAFRWGATPIRVALVLGALGVLGGGAVSAASAPAASENASWAAAYLVLVVGVAQLALAAGAAWLPAERPPSAGLLGWEFLAWNLGNAGVLVGTLTGASVLTDVGGALILVALVLALVAVRGAPRSLWLLAYRVIVVVVAVSVPVGLVIERLQG